MPQRRPHRAAPSNPRPRYRPTFEVLEDRTTPSVMAVQNGGVLTVTLDVNDSATLIGIAASGTAIDVKDNTANTTQPFTGVTGINVIDGATNAGQSVTFSDAGAGTAINVPGAISVTGIETVDFATANGAVQAASTSVVGAATRIRFDADVTTSSAGGQSYDGPVVLGNATVTLNAGATGGIAFLQSVNSDAGGSKALVLNSGGITSFTGIMGGTNALASLTTDAAGTTKLGANVVTVGAQTYNDPAIITGINVTLTANAGGNIRFAGTLDASTGGTNSLLANTSGTTEFDAAVGTTPLGGLTTDAPGDTILKGNVTTLGAQTYNDPVTLSGASILLTSTAGGNLSFNGTLDDDVDGATSLTINTTTGTTTFSGSVGVVHPLGSITTDAGGGSTVFGPNAAATRSVRTTGAQTYNDPVRLNAASVAFASTQNGNLTFGATLNGTSSVTTDALFNTGGDTVFTGLVGSTTPLATIATDDAAQAGEKTIVHASVTTTGAQTYADAVTFTPGTGITSQLVSSASGAIAFQKAINGTSAAPVSIRAGANVAFSGGATFSASGSRLNVQAGSTGTGAFAFASGLQFQADVQTWQAGDGVGGAASTATADLLTNAPAFRDATGGNAPRTFVLRQDGAVTDGTVPAVAQFGAATPPNYSILSDDSTLTLNTTTALAGAGTSNLTLASAQTLSLGATITAPSAIVRLRSSSANVSQTGGGIAAAGLGVRSGTFSALSGTNAVTGTFAAQATTGNIQFANGSAYTVGSIGASGPDPLTPIFASMSGVAAAAGTVTFSQPGTSPLNLTIAASVTGSTVTATGGSADDRVTVNYTGGGSVSSGLLFNGNGGNDTLTLSDAGSGTAHTYAIGGTTVRDTNAPITYTGVEVVSVAGGTAADTFNITPDATAAIAATGGLPSGTAGDKLTLTLAGAASPNLTATSTASGFQGTASFADRATVSFSQMETISPRADIQVTSSVSALFVPVGGSTTITVVVTNAGPDAVNGVKLDDVFPAGISGTWTATASAGSTVAAPSGTGDIHTTADLISNGTVTFTITAKATSGTLGSIANTFSASDATTAFDTNSANNQASSSFTVQALDLTAAGAGAGGGPQVKVFNVDGSLRFNFFAYDPAYFGGVTVATGDVNGDGVEDIVTGAAQGSSHVKVFDGATGSQIASFFAFPGFTGGVNVAVAHGEVLVGAGPGGGPIVSSFSAGGVPSFSFFAFDPAFRGGVQVGGSDQFITVGAGPGGGPHVKVFNATTHALVSSFFAFLPGSAGGVSVAMGTAGGRETVIAGAGIGAAPAVVTFDAITGNTVNNVLAFDPGFTGGVRTASTTTATGQAGTVVGAGSGGSPRVRVLAQNGTTVLDFFAFDPAFRGGVFVG